jgi:hypothetical protein|tara:strand:- start:158 stop:661 length:504 start_codon:yes stop_codon:yes gene_type:complete
MEKKVLSEQALYYGDVSMPKGFEINYDKFKADILQADLEKNNFKSSRNWDKLNTFIKDHINLKHQVNLVNKSTWGNFYKPFTLTEPLLQVDPVDLRNSPDFVLLYGVQVKDCFIKIFYDDNRRKGRSWDIELKNNMFVMFPSNNMYIIGNNDSKDLNFIQTITYEYI